MLKRVLAAALVEISINIPNADALAAAQAMMNYTQGNSNTKSAPSTFDHAWGPVFLTKFYYAEAAVNLILDSRDLPHTRSLYQRPIPRLNQLSVNG